MANVDEISRPALATPASLIPPPVMSAFRGIGQVFFQENALTGLLFLVGIAVSSPIMAVGAAVGTAIGTATGWLLKFDRAEVLAGIYGFNATLVGIATLFFFRPGFASISLLIVGCVAATCVTRLMRRYLPFPTYTTPFIVTTWAIFFLGQAMGVARVEAGAATGMVGVVGAVLHGVGQVMFQGSIWTGLLFLAGIAVNDWRHATWVLLGSVIGMLMGTYHAGAPASAPDPESLVERTLTENVALGLYGYNATLVAVALFLQKRTVILPLLGAILSVPLTDLVPMLGLPALTAPFVLATWLVMAMRALDGRLFRESSPVAT